MEENGKGQGEDRKRNKLEGRRERERGFKEMERTNGPKKTKKRALVKSHYFCWSFFSFETRQGQCIYIVHCVYWIERMVSKVSFSFQQLERDSQRRAPKNFLIESEGGSWYQAGFDLFKACGIQRKEKQDKKLL